MGAEPIEPSHGHEKVQQLEFEILAKKELKRLRLLFKVYISQKKKRLELIRYVGQLMKNELLGNECR